MFAKLVIPMVLISVAIPAVAGAAGAQPRVAIESFKGPHAQRLQGAVETGLMGRYYVVPDFSVEEMARKRGVAIGDPSGMAEVGRALQVRAFLSAEVQKKRAWHVAVVVRSGDTGAALGRFVVADRRLDHLESTLGARASKRIGAMLARASASGNTAAAGLEPASLEESADAVEASAGTAAPGEVISVVLDTRVFGRSFTYNQNVNALADYRLEGAVAAGLGAEFHPLAMVSEKWAPLGISAGLEYGLGINSRVAGSEQRSSTDVHGYSVGLNYRVRLGQSTITPTAGFALATFNAGQNSGAPNVDYRYLKGGLDGRFTANDRFAFLGRAEYLHALSAGPLTEANRFPRASVRGVEATLGIGLTVVTSVELQASVGLRRFGVDANSVPGDRWVAGGAVDQTTWASLGVAYRPSYTQR